jgi:hypothetical protein
MFDLMIRSDRVVTPAGVAACARCITPVRRSTGGTVGFENGTFSDDLADGQYLYRKISEEIRSGTLL